MSEVSLRELLQELAEERKFDLRGYKLTSVERRFRHRMFQLKIGDYSSYSDYIRRNPAEINDLLNTVLINTTQFFRDPQGWELLRTEILPKLTATLKPGDSFRVWSAGCASGEEPYSLAILLREHFGHQARDYDLKIYATDVDEDALDIARRGEYSTEKLRYVPRHWRENYFYPADKTARVGRDIRRMVIFGRSNLAMDAPISHLHLLLCRNVLIYFDSPLQRQTLTRLHFALEPAGVLMLGKSESQLIGSSLFTVLHPKWRIFQRREVDNRERARELRFVAPRQVEPLAKATRQNDSLIKLCHDALLETLEPSVILVDPSGVVINENQASRRLWGRSNETIVGKPLKDTPIAERCPELLERVDAVRGAPNEVSRFEFSMTGDKGERDLALTVKAVNEADGRHVATLIYADDITPRKKLQHTVQQLEATGQELQTTNRELETTNEELQATNEELETTSEELQSTNEELETTNEGLQALNEELGTTNEELEVRSKEVDELNARYSETLERMPWPLLLVSEHGKVQFWNTAAARMFGLESKSIIGLQLNQVPVSEKLRNLLSRNHRDVLARGRGKTVRDCEIDMNSFTGSVDMQFVPLPDEQSRSVIITLQMSLPDGGGSRQSGRNSNRSRAKHPSNAGKSKRANKKT